MAHATKRKNICTAKVSDDFQGFFLSPLVGFVGRSHHQRAQGDCRFGKSRHKTHVHLLVVSKVFTRYIGEVGRRWYFGDKIPKLIVGLSTASQALKQKTRQQATTQYYTALHSTKQHYTALHSTTQHYTALHNITQHYAVL